MTDDFRFATVTQALEHYAKSPAHSRKAAIMHARPGHGAAAGYQTLTFHALNQVTARLASHYETVFNKQQRQQQGGGPSKIKNVALYANSSPEYILSLWALLRAGYVPLCLSPRNSAAAVSHLATKAQAATVVRGRESNLVATTDALLREGAIGNVVDVISPEELQAIIDSVQAGQAPRYVASLLTYKWFGEQAQPDDVSYVLPPFYHAYGIFVSFNNLGHGTTVVLPAVPSWPPTTQMLVENITETKCNVLCLLPWLLESMQAEAEEAQDECIYKLLAGMRAVTYAAAALNERVGDALHRKGVVLINGYGSSEAGLVAANQIDPCTHWNHIQILPHVHHTMESHVGRRPNLYRLVIKRDNPMLALGQANTPEGDYDMNDILERTNPTPMEAAVRNHCPAVLAAAVVGQQRFSTALLVELKPGIEPTTPDVLESLWRAVQVANQTAPQHSRILREMIHVMGAGEGGGIPRTDKGSLRRKHIEERFKARIDELARFAGVAPEAEAAGLSDPRDIAAWLEQRLVRLYNDQTVAAAAVPGEKLSGLEHDVSIFAQGFDSLLATQFYHQYLRPAFPNLKLPANLLYQCSDIDHLAARLAAMLQGGAAAGGADERNTVRQAEELYEKYLRQLDEDHARGLQAGGAYARPAVERVVLTGCTGGLGLFLLARLLDSPRVERVYALVRAGGGGGGRESVEAKLSRALRGKLLDPALAEHDKLTLWGCHLNRPKLGLADDQWDELARHSTSVIHNAWLLNFEATPIEFEESCIKPSYELMRLCSADALKQYMFVSSITAAIRNVAGPQGTVPEQVVDDQHRASAMGYGQSKLVTERLAARYAERFSVPVTIARVGQIAGDSIHGTWNTSEHLPLMIKAIETLRAMPDHYMSVDSLPVDVVAETMTTLLTDAQLPGETEAERKNTRVAHLVNPVELPWLDFLKILQSPDLGLPKFRVVKARKWLRLLEESSPDPVANPIKKLQGYFADMYTAEEVTTTKAESQGLEAKFETVRTTQLVPSMHYNLNHDFWCKVIGHWRDIGFLQRLA
ncbi:NADbinding domain 4 domain containing protein [Acanthamoeba castellanii str. Neff]|uniref:NADbinding domain 4 domain containing protein n=1 Tax=Acanthamoeba castellanii (strain ATCC 30010 / Neff) TaxID=1257118 RepID=L8H4L6_ACACF|nr:NADbinding domain 4 domain containing protein [Acanthamoeba castellanii str. Neff]ELR20147.1 NADbinding domain 4 domain containing protein [Acanthamoeba castellanii str. Neff]